MLLEINDKMGWDYQMFVISSKGQTAYKRQLHGITARLHGNECSDGSVNVTLGAKAAVSRGVCF